MTYFVVSRLSICGRVRVEPDKRRPEITDQTDLTPTLDTPSQFRILHPFQHKKRTFDPADFTQCGVKAVLARVAGQLANDERSSHRPVPDRSCQSQDLFPLHSDQFQIEPAPDQRSEGRMIPLFPWHIKPLVAEIPYAGRKAKA